MGLALPNLKRLVRVSTEPAMTPAEFWDFTAEHRDLRMERDADGTVRIMTPTKRNTGSRNSYISAMLAIWTYADGRGDCFDSSTGFDLPDSSVLSPDAAWISWDRLKLADAAPEFTPLVPEFLIELRSQSDALTEARAKMERWMDAGVQLAWLIDPSRKAVEIYRPGQQPEIREEHTAVYGEGLVSGFVLELARIWS